MPIIRPTQALWRSLGGKRTLPAVERDEDGSRLGEWLARPAKAGRRKLVLFGNPETLLTVLVPLGRFEQVMVAFREALTKELSRIEVPQEDIDREVENLADVIVAKTNDRSTLGSLNDLAFMVEHAAAHQVERGGVDLAEIQIALNQTPHVKRDPSYADEAVRKLFGLGPRQRRWLQLRVTLRHVEPQVWRRLVVPADISFAELHHFVQEAMGWQNCHLHQFEAGDRRLAPPGPGELECEDESAVRIESILAEVNSSIEYWYDFGDDWWHDLVVEETLLRDPRNRRPEVSAGEGQCPPEDSGGPHRYMEILDLLAHPEKYPDDYVDEITDWIGGDYDPRYFDLSEADQRLARYRR